MPRRAPLEDLAVVQTLMAGHPHKMGVIETQQIPAMSDAFSVTSLLAYPRSDRACA